MVKTFASPCLGLAALGLLGGACTPDVEGGASIIDAPRVLAIRSEPAEAAPKSNPPTTITWTALFVGPDGDQDASVLDWAICTERKPLVTAGEMSLECLAKTGDALIPVGTGESASGVLPDDGCRLFGPNPPLPKAGEPAPRPTDPDATGGFYQPLRLLASVPAGDQYSVGLTRISCGLARVTGEQTLDFQERYRPNENPEFADIVVVSSSGNLPLSDDPLTTATVKAGSTVTLSVSWPECPLTSACGDGICGASEDRMNCAEDCKEPHGCQGAEPYVAFDLSTRQILDRREGMRVSWYSNVGTFEHDRTGRPESQAASPYSNNGWTAPNGAVDARLWLVLRDDRGGVAFRSLIVHVE